MARRRFLPDAEENDDIGSQRLCHGDGGAKVVGAELGQVISLDPAARGRGGRQRVGKEITGGLRIKGTLRPRMTNQCKHPHAVRHGGEPKAAILIDSTQGRELVAV
ncbi:hypothetical protein X750_31130 [Mesorhizobium sp. LNJC394B00]|nr:hypothetical protein X750_31130 [Mesorhizobium sp. LNJC394B00]